MAIMKPSKPLDFDVLIEQYANIPKSGFPSKKVRSHIGFLSKYVSTT